MRWLSGFDVFENSSLIHVQHWFGLINSDTPVKCEWATFAFTLTTPQRIVEMWISICRWHFHWMAEFNNLLKTIIGILCQCLWCFNAWHTHTDSRCERGLNLIESDWSGLQIVHIQYCLMYVYQGTFRRYLLKWGCERIIEMRAYSNWMAQIQF